MIVRTENQQKELFKHFQEKVVQYLMKDYNKGQDVLTIIKFITDVNSDKWSRADLAYDVTVMYVNKY